MWKEKCLYQKPKAATNKKDESCEENNSNIEVSDAIYRCKLKT